MFGRTLNPTLLLLLVRKLTVITDCELMVVALTPQHLHHDTGVGSDASTRVTPAAASNVCFTATYSYNNNINNNNNNNNI